MSFWRYLFPKGNPRNRIPLLPRDYTDPRAQEERSGHWQNEYLKGRLATRSERGARHLRRDYSELTVEEIAKLKVRKRKAPQYLVRAWRRFKDLW